jgi:hypothetical protein
MAFKKLSIPNEANPLVKCSSHPERSSGGTKDFVLPDPKKGKKVL